MRIGFCIFLIFILQGAHAALAATPQVSFSATKLSQGDAFFVTVSNETNIRNVSGKFLNKSIGFAKIGNKIIGIAGIDAKRTPGTYAATVTVQNTSSVKNTITVASAKFKTTVLEITPQLKTKGFTPTTIIKGVGDENAILNKILLAYTKTAYFTKPFALPLNKIKVSGPFGDIRKTGHTAAQHLGTDLDTPLNTPVHAANDGVVAYAGELPTYGKTLVIDHGLGIFSLYLHLNTFKVSKGQRVKQGTIIALSGNTGYSTAPHLHFSIKINGSSIDPLKFVETMQKMTK